MEVLETADPLPGLIEQEFMVMQHHTILAVGIRRGRWRRFRGWKP